MTTDIETKELLKQILEELRKANKTLNFIATVSVH